MWVVFDLFLMIWCGIVDVCFVDFVSLGSGCFFMAVLDNVGSMVCTKYELANIMPYE